MGNLVSLNLVNTLNFFFQHSPKTDADVSVETCNNGRCIHGIKVRKFHFFGLLKRCRKCSQRNRERKNKLSEKDQTLLDSIHTPSLLERWNIDIPNIGNGCIIKYNCATKDSPAVDSYSVLIYPSKIYQTEETQNVRLHLDRGQEKLSHIRYTSFELLTQENEQDVEKLYFRYIKGESIKNPRILIGWHIQILDNRKGVQFRGKIIACKKNVLTRHSEFTVQSTETGTIQQLRLKRGEKYGVEFDLIKFEPNDDEMMYPLSPRVTSGYLPPPIRLAGLKPESSRR